MLGVRMLRCCLVGVAVRCRTRRKRRRKKNTPILPESPSNKMCILTVIILMIAWNITLFWSMPIWRLSKNDPEAHLQGLQCRVFVDKHEENKLPKMPFTNSVSSFLCLSASVSDINGEFLSYVLSVSLTRPQPAKDNETSMKTQSSWMFCFSRKKDCFP